MFKQFDVKRIQLLKDILLRLRDGVEADSLVEEVEQFFTDVSIPEVLLMELEMIDGVDGVTMNDVKELSRIYAHIGVDGIGADLLEKAAQPGHPLAILQAENRAFETELEQMDKLFYALVIDEKQPEVMAEIQDKFYRIGAFHKHYHRKEKLYFPVMERYGHFTPTSLVWRKDDQIRSSYQAAKRRIDRMPAIDIDYVRQAYDTFAKAFRAMVFQEEELLLPVFLTIFKEEEWVEIARESAAFGYAFVQEDEQWEQGAAERVKQPEKHTSLQENMPFGAGYLTGEEANLILNNLPLEITFVDRNSIFKYFNEATEAADMMLVRTPISIGRNVANCHPPKSLKKVMTLIRDLKTKKRRSESMWFKKGDHYVHLTYKALFDEQDAFVGILEYVQDIQPFFELPREAKTGLSKLEE